MTFVPLWQGNFYNSADGLDAAESREPIDRLNGST